jgi:hypothetical protein
MKRASIVEGIVAEGRFQKVWRWQSFAKMVEEPVT